MKKPYSGRLKNQEGQLDVGNGCWDGNDIYVCLLDLDVLALNNRLNWRIISLILKRTNYIEYPWELNKPIAMIIKNNKLTWLKNGWYNPVLEPTSAILFKPRQSINPFIVAMPLQLIVTPSQCVQSCKIIPVANDHKWPDWNAVHRKVHTTVQRLPAGVWSW